jgi:Flp pilus assembly protein TadD
MVFVSQELFDEAVRLEEEGQNEHALAIYRRISEFTQTRNLFLRLAGCAENMGLAEEAERAFQRALEIDGRSALALWSLGNLAVRRGAYETAADYLKRASEIRKDPGIFSVLGVALRNAGKDDEAEEAYRTAIRVDANYEEAHYNLGVLLRSTDRSFEAQIHLRKALELDPAYAAAHRELGFVLWQIKRGADPEVEGHLRKSIELAPDDPWAHVYLGAYLHGGEAAETEFRIAAKLKPDWAYPLTWLGKAHESRDLDMAQSFFERALQLESDDWEALSGLARVFKQRGEFELAREYITRALQQDPGDEKSLSLLNKINAESSRRIAGE